MRRNGRAVSVPCSTPKRTRPPVAASRWTCDAIGDAEAAVELLGLEQAGELLGEAGLGQGQDLAGVPEHVGVGRRGW